MAGGIRRSPQVAPHRGHIPGVVVDDVECKTRSHLFERPYPIAVEGEREALPDQPFIGLQLDEHTPHRVHLVDRGTDGLRQRKLHDLGGKRLDTHASESSSSGDERRFSAACRTMSHPIRTVRTMELITHDRVNHMWAAIELGVDIDDFRFVSPDERTSWLELLAEYEARVDKSDDIWLPTIQSPPEKAQVPAG